MPGGRAHKSSILHCSITGVLLPSALVPGRVRTRSAGLSTLHTARFASEASFDDDRPPGHFIPFNVQNTGGVLFVAFGQQNRAKNFVNVGPGLGAVYVFSSDGQLVQRLETGRLLTPPWGV